MVSHWRDFFPNDYLSAYELQGKDVTLTINKIEHEHLKMEGGKESTEAVISFNESPKKMITKKTHMGLIAKTMGVNDPAHWIGKKITIYPTQCKGEGGRMVDCIRTRVNREGMQ